MEKIDRQMTKISINDDLEVKLSFLEIIPLDSDGPVTIDAKSKGNGTDDDDEEEEEDEIPNVITNKFTAESPRRPHKDFLDAMKKLRKFALDVCEIAVDTKALTDYTVSQVSISGDVLMKQSRVVMTIAKKVKRTGKVVTIKTPQVTMYGESEYDKAAEMSKAVENAIAEAWAYIAGKYEESGQLPLFVRVEEYDKAIA